MLPPWLPWVWVSSKPRNEGYYSPRLIYVVFHTSPSLLSLSSYPRSSYSFPSLISSTESTLFLNDTWCTYIMYVHFVIFMGVTVDHSSSVTFFPLTFTVFCCWTQNETISCVDFTEFGGNTIQFQNEGRTTRGGGHCDRSIWMPVSCTVWMSVSIWMPVSCTSSIWMPVSCTSLTLNLNETFP